MVGLVEGGGELLKSFSTGVDLPMPIIHRSWKRAEMDERKTKSNLALNGEHYHHQPACEPDITIEIHFHNYLQSVVHRDQNN